MRFRPLSHLSLIYFLEEVTFFFIGCVLATGFLVSFTSFGAASTAFFFGASFSLDSAGAAFFVCSAAFTGSLVSFLGSAETSVLLPVSWATFGAGAAGFAGVAA